MSTVSSGYGKSGGGGGGGKKPNNNKKTQKIAAQNKRSVKKSKKPGMVGLQQLPARCPTCSRTVPAGVEGKRITRRIAIAVKKHFKAKSIKEIAAKKK